MVIQRLIIYLGEKIVRYFGIVEYTKNKISYQEIPHVTNTSFTHLLTAAREKERMQ